MEQLLWNLFIFLFLLILTLTRFLVEPGNYSYGDLQVKLNEVWVQNQNETKLRFLLEVSDVNNKRPKVHLFSFNLICS